MEINETAIADAVLGDISETEALEAIEDGTLPSESALDHTCSPGATPDKSITAPLC